MTVNLSRCLVFLLGVEPCCLIRGKRVNIALFPWMAAVRVVCRVGLSRGSDWGESQPPLCVFLLVGEVGWIELACLVVRVSGALCKASFRGRSAAGRHCRACKDVVPTRSPEMGGGLFLLLGTNLLFLLKWHHLVLCENRKEEAIKGLETVGAP